MHFYDFLVKIPLPASKIPLVPGDDFAEANWYPLNALPIEDMGATLVNTLIQTGLIGSQENTSDV